MAVNCPAAGWTVLNSHKKLQPLSTLSVADLVMLINEFSELKAMPHDFFDEAKTVIARKSTLTADVVKRKFLSNMTEFLATKQQKEPDTQAANRSTLLAQIIRGLEPDLRIGLKAELGYCAVVRKTESWNRWYVITKDDSLSFESIDGAADFILKTFW